MKELVKDVENLHHYTRRPNIRIFGLPVPAKENSKEVVGHVKQIIDRCGMDISHGSIDRAHRIGRKKVGVNGITNQPVIVRFTSFRDRTKFYHMRKDIT